MEIVRGLTQRRLRSTLAVAGVGLGILVLTLAGALAEHVAARFAGGVRYYSAAIQVADDAGASAGVVSLTKLDQIQRVPGVAVALPSIQLLARPGSVPAVPLGSPDTIVYADPREPAYSRLKTALGAGRQLQANRQGEVVLGADIAAELGVKVGDSLDLPVKPKSANPDFVNHPFKVVGVLRQTGTLPDRTASVGLLDAQMLLQESLPSSFRDRVDPSSLASGITVYAKPGVSADQLADRISATVPGVAATRPADYVRGFDQGAPFTAAAFVAGALAALFGALVVGGAMQLAVAERGREIALKMAFGARSWHIAAECVVEACGMALLGGVTGLGLGLGVAALLDLAGRSIGMDVFLVTARVAEVALGLAALLGIGAGLAAALRAARTDPDAALRAV
ncbi:MAG TPA: ABC transporter permease [Candidatus Dormibacteraeota bacterium]|nr:ABC transporter permease [Candidatus Dormibacteraeota bacterium]